MKKLKLKSMKVKIIIGMLIVMLIMGNTILYAVTVNIKDTLYTRVHEQINDNLTTAMDFMDAMTPGEWKLEGEKLYKGDLLINDSTVVVDAIRNSIDAPVTFFAKDTRVSTNVMDNNGKRILGTKASKTVTDEVLNKGNEYVGTVQVNGIDYEGKYIPLKDVKGNIVGMFFLGEEKSNIEEDLRKHMNSVIIVIIIILVISLVLSAFLIGKILKRIENVAKSMVLVGEGDFTIRSNIKSGDEMQLLSDAQNKMAEHLGNLISKIGKTSKELAISSEVLSVNSQETTASSGDILKAINNISESTLSQTYQVCNGLDKTMELANNIQQVSSSIDTIRNMFNTASILNNKGMEVVEVLLNKTELSNTAGENVSKSIMDMDTSLQKISLVMNTITQIANQTNLLSLNASIEAANAGDAGRGFSIVASEIGKLATQSSVAAKEIRDIINGIQAQSKKSVTEMNITKNVTIEHDEAVNETKQIFKEISNTISNLVKEAVKINEINKEMVSHKDNIVIIMEDLAMKSEETSATTEQVFASSQEQVAGIEEVNKTVEQLNRIAQELDTEIQKFKV